MASPYYLLPEDLCFLIHLYHARDGVVAFSVKATPQKDNLGHTQSLETTDVLRNSGEVMRLLGFPSFLMTYAA